VTTPLKSLKIDLNDPKKRQTIKTRNVPNYDASKYACERRTVLSRDGKTEIPISLVYNKAQRTPDKPQHLHLYGYGSYGACMECYFSSSRLPLLDRGIVYVIAHVRGGGELGRQWYEEPNGAKVSTSGSRAQRWPTPLHPPTLPPPSQYLCKKNTFNDFVDVAQHLQDTGVTAADIMSTEGRSAGGLLMGASINQKPELFKAAIYGVPFVDVTCTMVDHTIPLTVVEWEEWGNPNEKKYAEYINSYSPVNNVKPGGKYPSTLLTGGLHDPRVAYWEPAKMAAELRHTADSEQSGPVLLKLDMAAGHFSASDRYKYVRAQRPSRPRRRPLRSSSCARLHMGAPN
jgi:oligopeptidase B